MGVAGPHEGVESGYRGIGGPLDGVPTPFGAFRSSPRGPRARSYSPVSFAVRSAGFEFLGLSRQDRKTTDAYCGVTLPAVRTYEAYGRKADLDSDSVEIRATPKLFQAIPLPFRPLKFFWWKFPDPATNVICGDVPLNRKLVFSGLSRHNGLAILLTWSPMGGPSPGSPENPIRTFAWGY